ncbi:MAG TPA: SRPBCC family protein [Pyrinomonadaceae bacterium]|nr:SRPBCC family protein [Pyrinomonadaceae bacterium]
MIAQTGSLFRSAPASDQILEQRVRSKMGRVVSHPHAIQVKGENGRVTLSGPILAHEVKDLMTSVAGVSGVTEVIDNLDVHKQAGNISALQGGQPRPGDEFELMQTNWSPAARAGAGAAGAALVGYALARRERLCLLAGAIGLGLFARAASNTPVKRLVGVGAGRRAVEVQKAINIDAPVDQVYEFWHDFQNFPLFMSNVQEVRVSDGRSHWVISGPAGVNIEWDACVTREIPNELLAWKTERGAAVKSAGLVRFKPNEKNGTTVEIKLSYNPPAGAVGHAVAKVFGADPKTQMDEDLLRMKTLIETGIPPRDAAVPVR